mmetsp:Transcript_41868/g.97492  ORF Transcript_41868/g.97492 Transcript_41868/m.97492 type:complete len:252 (-) Transcript_41868:223-978(-)
MVTAETIVPCLENDAHKVGAIVATVTAFLSSGIAYYLQHIGLWVKPEFAIKGCRNRLLQDISCGGVQMPEYAIFGLGFSFTALCMAHAFQKAGYVLEKYSTLSSREVRAFRLAGLIGCLATIPMAWVSMKMNREIHLLFAGMMMASWLFAFTLRCKSGSGPYHRLAIFTCVLAVVFLGIWFTAISLGSSHHAWAEWMGFLCFLLHSFSFPVPATGGFSMFHRHSDVELQAAEPPLPPGGVVALPPPTQSLS